MGRRVTETEEATPMREEITTTDAEAFSRCTEPFRRELLAHCYRMLGSVTDAEDLVQETYLRAWRGFDGFSGTSSVRSWLYRIATNACLTALERRGRLALPSGLCGPSDDPDSPPAAGPDRGWLQPIPDALTDAEWDDPAAVVARREGLRLALISSLQFLPPRQRAVLVLREVMAFSAAEVAAMLDTTVPAVKSTLQRARARLEQINPATDRIVEPAQPQARALLNRFIKAFEDADPHALTQLLLTEATLEATPQRTWFAGLDTCLPFLIRHVLGSPGHWRMEPTRANGSPAVAAYSRGSDGNHHAYGIVLLDLARGGIARITSFGDPDLVALFGLPPILLAGSPPGLALSDADRTGAADDRSPREAEMPQTDDDPPETELDRAIGPHRRDLLTYCHLVLGSINEARRVVTGTCRQARRHYSAVPDPATLRLWLYRTATDACLHDQDGIRPDERSQWHDDPG